MGKLEKIERNVMKEVKAELSKTEQINEEIFAKVESIVTKKFRTKYFESLEEQVIALHPPMWHLRLGFGIDPEKNKEYARLSNIVLSVFALIENKINYLLRIKLDRNFAEVDRPPDGVNEALNILLDEKNYTAKVESLSALYKSEKINTDLLFDLGRIRNAFAHTLSVRDKKYIFKKRNVADNLYAFDDLIENVLEIKDKLETIAERQPEVEEFNRNIKEIIDEVRREQEEKKQ